MIQKVRDFFMERYAYVNFQEISDAQIEEFMARDYIQGLAFENQMDLLYDFIVSQGLAEVEE